MGAIIFIVAMLGIAFIILRRKSPETADKIVGAVLAAIAAFGAWLGGVFDKLAG